MNKGKQKDSKDKTKKPNGDLAIQKGLMNIYSNQDGSLPDISHLDVRRKGKWRIVLLSFVIIALLLSAIAWVGFLIFNPDSTFSNQSIKLEIKSQQNIASGDEVIYILKYKNIEKVDLYNVEIIFRYPDGFEFSSAQPEPSNEFNNSWIIGDLKRGKSGQIEIKGKLIGEVGSIKTLNATATFQPENFSSVFKESNSFSNQITSSILEINVEGPDKILPEKQTTYKITYKNNSEQTLDKIKIIAIYPTNFIFQQANPESYHRQEDARNLNNQWVIENLEPKTEGEIEITGGYISDEDIPIADFKIQIGFNEEETDEFSLQQEKSILTEIIEPNLDLKLIINGSDQNQPINFGQTLTCSLIYKNLGKKDLDEVVLKLNMNSDVLDWESLVDKNQGIIEDNIITWTKEEISELDLIRPLDEGSIDFTINIKEADDVNINEDILQVVSKAFAGIEKIGELEVEDLVVESNEINNSINTDIQLKIEGRYFNDDNIAVGTGPLPPVVGQETTFRIYWYLANSLHEINNVKITTTLPEGVEWADKYLVGAGDISYSNIDNKVTWSLGRVSTNKNFDELYVWFDISVTPNFQQTRKLLILTDQTTLTATDEVTNSEITKAGKAVTSNLEDDPIGTGRGLVIDITE